MGIFRHNSNKPATGYKKDGLRKKGIHRFFEILVRDFWELIKLNLMFCICVLPTVILFLLSLFGFYSGITFALSIVAALPVGGAVTAYIFYLTMMLRDEPSNVWYECKRKFIENFRQAAATGIICTGILYTQVLLWVVLLQSDPGHELFWGVVTFFAMILFFMITPYLFMHFAYIELGTFQILKNSIMMSFAYVVRSLMGAIFGCAMWVLFALYFPISMMVFPVVFVIGISLSILLCLMWVWPPFDKMFKIEETLTKE
ncbi:MAG: hypothetical protein FWD99_07980 [Oscillospiraceae bacterium]|nr:hypothetical protein [Oscillospiraceae bacterium]